MKETILEAFDFYRSLGPSERLVMSEGAVDVHLPHGAVFYREGEDLQHMALVGSGNIRVFKTASNGRELTLYHVLDGQPAWSTCSASCSAVGRWRRRWPRSRSTRCWCPRAYL